jgi:hypothetical protein
VWFYVLALIVLAGAVINELRFERVRRPEENAGAAARAAATTRRGAPLPTPASPARVGRSDVGEGENGS